MPLAVTIIPDFLLPGLNIKEQIPPSGKGSITSWFNEARPVPSSRIGAWRVSAEQSSQRAAAAGHLAVPLLGKRGVSASIPLTGLLANPRLARSRRSQEDLQRKQFKTAAYLVLISKINKIKWIIHLEITCLPPTLACGLRHSGLPLDITAYRTDQRSNNNYQYNYTCSKIKPQGFLLFPVRNLARNQRSSCTCTRAIKKIKYLFWITSLSSSCNVGNVDFKHWSQKRAQKCIWERTK